MRVAEFFRENGSASECLLCPHHCQVSEGQRGRCHGRGPVSGQMTALNYGLVIAANVDPIEKKPLYHFYPGTSIVSVGTFGCNLTCRFCQNADLSQAVHSADVCPPEQLVERALRVPGNVGVAFTYNEPGIWYEYVLDASILLRQRGLRSVMVTNGFLEDEPWQMLCRHVDAMNIDLKAFTEEFYHQVCGGALAPVKRNIASAVAAGVHVEVTHLVIPGLNDQIEDFQRLVDWLASVGSGVPLHLSRYFPRHRETAPPTSPEILQLFREVAGKSLEHVYIGNIDVTGAQNTCCPGCGETLIERSGYRTRILLQDGVCRCGAAFSIPGLPGRDEVER